MFNFTIAEILAFFQKYGYPFMFIGSFIEGVNVMILGGFFAARGYFSFPIVWLMMFLGDILGDITWYYIGYFGGKKIVDKFGHFLGIKRHYAKVKGFLERRGGKVIVFIKFTAGLCLAMLITAGTVRMEFKKFMKYDIIGSIGWVTFACGLGYFVGESYDLLSQYLHRMGVVLAVLTVLAFVIIKLVQRFTIRVRKLE